MQQRESAVFAKLRERILRPTDRFERVENGLAVGMPDVNYCIAGQEGWLEIKAPKEPARAGTALFGAGNHQVSIDQINWMHRQHLAGGFSFLFIYTGKRMLLIQGARVASLERRINELPLSEMLQQAVWRCEVPVREVELWMDLRERLARP